MINQYVMAPFGGVVEPFVWWDDGFTEEELDFLQNMALNSSTKAALADGVLLPSTRNSEVTWLNCSKDSRWLYDKLAYIANELNSKYYRFDLSGFGESLQITNYSTNGKYGWHVDHGSKIGRKLSMVLQLSNPSDYEGGDLQINTGGEPVTVKKKRGLLAAFPSFHLHQVSPVTKGNRQSLVTWISGPMFR
jgi:PKHD-type hydroxylase